MESYFFYRQDGFDSELRAPAFALRDYDHLDYWDGDWKPLATRAPALGTWFLVKGQGRLKPPIEPLHLAVAGESEGEGIYARAEGESGLLQWQGARAEFAVLVDCLALTIDGQPDVRFTYDDGWSTPLSGRQTFERIVFAPRSFFLLAREPKPLAAIGVRSRLSPLAERALVTL
jgi:hypothetical protein